MPKIFVHALEGPPQSPGSTESTERDIRISWLIGRPGGPRPWSVSSKVIPGEIVLDRFGPPVPRYIDEVHLKFIPDGDTLANQLMSGEVHFAPSLTDPGTFARLLGDPHVRVVATGGLNLFYLGFRMEDRAPCNDVNLRRAVAQAIDVYEYLPLGKGAAAPAVGPIPPSMHGHVPVVPHDLAVPRDPAVPAHRRSFDLRISRESLRKASGRTPPLTILSGPSKTYAGRLAEAIAKDLSRHLGLTVSANCCSSWNGMRAAFSSGTGDMFIYSWNQRHSYPEDPIPWMHALFHSKGKGNLTGWRAADADVGPSEPVNHERAHQKIHDEVPMVFLSHWNRMAAYRDNVVGLRLTYGALPEDRLVDVDVI